jgi:PKHD-type hydroxylase
MLLTSVKIKTDFCYWDDLFCSEELDEITDYCNSLVLSEGKIGLEAGVLFEKTRKSKIGWVIRNDDNHWFFRKMDSAINKLNNEYFGFDIYSLDKMQYTVYDGHGEHYTWHHDMLMDSENMNDFVSESQRKLSCVLQLSDPKEYNGGDLELFVNGQNVNMKKKRGYMSVFPSFVNHRVTPLQSGLRKTLVAWFTGPDWR